MSQLKSEEIQNKIYSIVGYRFSLSSSRQMSRALYGDQKLPVLSKTKTGVGSTSEDALKKLASKGYEVAALILSTGRRLPRSRRQALPEPLQHQPEMPLRAQLRHLPHLLSRRLPLPQGCSLLHSLPHQRPQSPLPVREQPQRGQVLMILRSLPMRAGSGMKRRLNSLPRQRLLMRTSQMPSRRAPFPSTSAASRSRLTQRPRAKAAARAFSSGESSRERCLP